MGQELRALTSCTALKRQCKMSPQAVTVTGHPKMHISVGGISLGLCSAKRFVETDDRPRYQLTQLSCYRTEPSDQ